MANLTSIVKRNILEELRKGNLDILKDLSPLESMQYGLALQEEVTKQIENQTKESKEVTS